MSYASLTEIYKYLGQLTPDTATDTLLQSILDRATNMIDTYLGFSYAGYSDETDLIVYGGGGPNLTLPPHDQGTVTTIVPEDGTPVDDTTWTEQPDGTVYLNSAYVSYPAPYASYNQYPGWGLYRYTVSADWGYGTVPDAVKEVCLELAMNIWKQKDKGFVSDFIGVNGTSGQRFSGGLPTSIRYILEIERAKWTQEVVFA